MPFLVGYFGKNASDFKEHIKYNLHEKENRLEIQDENLIIFTGVDTKELHQSDRIISLGNLHGLILGKIFNRESYQIINAFDCEKDSLSFENFEFFAKKFWGRYCGSF